MKTYFKEEQRFTQPWLWIVLVLALSAATVPVAAGLYVQLIKGEPFGNNPTSDENLIIIFSLVMLFTVGIIALFWKTKLVTEVRSDGLYVRFPPFIIKKIFFPPDTIASYYIRRYKPIKEYGGWGVKNGTGRSKAFNVKGNTGMQLEFKTGRKLLIGTQRGDAFLRAMNKMMKKY